MNSDPDVPAGRRMLRRVPAGRAFDWYAEAMRLFKRHPWGFVGQAIAVIATELLLGLIPVAGRPLSNVVVPIVACGLLYASLAVDRGDRPRAAHLVAPFAAPAGALGAVILSALVVFLAEWTVAWQSAGANLLAPEGDHLLGPADVLLVYAAGVAASLPLTLVPLVALFEGAGVADALATSFAAFRDNVGAFLLYGALSVALLGLAIVTAGIVLPVVLPLWAASTYTAWKDLFGATARGEALTR